MNIRKRIGIGSILVGCCAAIGAVVVPGRVTAGDDEQQVSLHNDTTDTNYTPEDDEWEDECPAEGDHWHFVIAPNSGYAFVQIHLVVDGSGYDFYAWSSIIKNGSQEDNVFVEVPAGKTLGDLEKTGSYALMTPDSGSPQFVLSHTCDGDEGATESTDPTDSTDESTSTTDEGGEEGGGPTTTDSGSGADIPGAGADNGTLAMLAAFLLIGGGTLVFTSRRRPAETSN